MDRVFGSERLTGALSTASSTFKSWRSTARAIVSPHTKRRIRRA